MAFSSASSVTYSSCVLSSNKWQMIRGGTAYSSALMFSPNTQTKTARNKLPMRVTAILSGGPMIREPSVNGSEPNLQTQIPVVDESVIPTVDVVSDNEKELVLHFTLPGLSKKDIKHEVSKDYDYLIIKGKERQQGSGENANDSWIWMRNIAYDTHFRLPKDWDKNSKIHAKFDEAMDVLIVKVPKSLGLNDDDSFEME